MKFVRREINFRSLVAALCAALCTLLIFIGARKNDFVDLDDLGYIVENRFIDVFDWNTVVWAFTSFHEANWHPLTMLSLAFDRLVWGLSPPGFHLTNILIHSSTVFFVCFLYAALIRAYYASNSSEPDEWLVTAGAFAAALFFGIHPLRVESVVWASERKDVLCLFFIVAAVWWHIYYVRQSVEAPDRRLVRNSFYWMALVSSGCALMSKPLAVSLPLVLLIVDWCPLGRIEDRDGFSAAVREKLPLFVMSAVTVVLTVCAQQFAMSNAPEANFVSRAMVACKALVFYLFKMFWPTNLAPYYPHPGNVALDRPLEFLPFVLLVALTAGFVAFFGRRHRVWVAVTLFYTVTLAPMLGLVQAGSQWIADRYSYLPSVGISLLWGGGIVMVAGRLLRSGRRWPALLLLSILSGQLLVYAGMTLRQVPVWRTTETLATREIELYPHHAGAAFFSRAKYRQERGDCAGALEDVDKALAIALRRNLKSKYAELSLARAEAFACLGRLPEALAAADWAIETADREHLGECVEFRAKLLVPAAGYGRHK